MYRWCLNSLPMSIPSDVETEMNFGEATYLTISIQKMIRDMVMNELYESDMFDNYRNLREYCMHHGPTYQPDEGGEVDG